MASRKFKTYCKIIDYVDVADPELSELLRGTCSDMVLNTGRGKPGVTFLMPQDKAYRKKIADLAYSSKVEEANKASDMLNALIIRDVFKTPADWMAKKDDIPNSLMPSQHVEVESANGKEIVFKSGARAVVDTDFIDASKRSNLAVWKLVSGELPVTTDKLAKHKYAKMGKKEGGYDPVVAGIADRERFKIMLAIENSYALSQMQRTMEGQRRNVYLEYTLSLIDFIHRVRNDTATLHERVLPLVSLDRIDIYLLLEPHTSRPCILDDQLVHEWWASRGDVSKLDCKRVLEDVDKLLSSGPASALVYSNRAGLLDAIDATRQRLSACTETRPRACVDAIAAEYDIISANNQIGGLGPVWPAPIAKMYADEPGLKIVHDELRYLCYGAFKRLESEAQFDWGRYHEIVNMIGECLFAQTADDRGRSQKLLNKQSIKYLISPGDKIQEIQMFLSSTMFAHIPMTKAEANGLRAKNSQSRPDPSHMVVFNIQKDLYAQHARLPASAQGPWGDLATILMSLDPETLDPQLKEALRSKLSA